MIVLDENIHGQRITAGFEAWYRGRVVSITILGPNSVIKDDAIPTLLTRADRPTFVTINTRDFWRRVRANSRYYIVNVELPNERAVEVPTLVRRLFRVQGFRSKAERLGKIVRLQAAHIEFYGGDGQIQVIAWPT